MVSHDPAKFGGCRRSSSGDITLLVVEQQEPFLPDNFMNNKIKQRPKISILFILACNPKKQENS